MSRKQVVFFMGIAIVLTFGLQRANGQGKREDLKEKRITIQMTNERVFNVFLRLMYVYDIPIGFEESTLDKDHSDYFFQTLMPPDDKKKDFPDEPETMSGSSPSSRWTIKDKAHLISLDFREARLEDVLDEIVRQMQNYDWTINDGVVNIFPVKGRDSNLEKLLNLRIRGFGVSKGEEFEAIQPLLVLYLPEFKAFLAENNLFAESDRYVPSYGKLPLPVELRFSNLSFKELLNGITRLKRGGWILRTGDKHKKPENKDKEVIEILI